MVDDFDLGDQLTLILSNKRVFTMGKNNLGKLGVRHPQNSLNEIKI